VGKVVVSYRPKATTTKTAAAALPLDRDVTPATKTPRCIIDTQPFFGDTNVTQPYRHMFTTLEEKANLSRLDDWLVTRGEALLERLPEDFAQVEAVGVPRQDTITCVGRICNEVRKRGASDEILDTALFFSVSLAVAVDPRRERDCSIPPAETERGVCV